MNVLKSRFPLLLSALFGLLSACQTAPSASTEIPAHQPSTTQLTEVLPTPFVKATQTDIPELAILTQTPQPEQADADVLFVHAILQPDGSWTFNVTVEHPDTGWEDYADGWDVVTLSGEILKRNPDDPFTRLLLHPHVEEQPFTRNQSGIRIPEGIEQVLVRAHDLISGFGGKEVLVDLTQFSGTDFEVSR
jgi:hypothetical protein